MPLFKQIKFKYGDQEISIRVNVDGSGKFWFTPSNILIEALKLESDKIYFDAFSEAESKARELYDQYYKLKTTYEYLIRYRLTISSKLKAQIPTAMMSNKWDLLKEVWNNRYHHGEAALIIHWYPAVVTRTGDKSYTKKLRKPTESDLSTMGHQTEEKRIEWLEIAHGLYYPFGKPGESDAFLGDGGENLFYSDEQEAWQQIPLTKDTLAFFEAIEGSMLKIVTGLMGLLTQEPDKLLSTVDELKSKGLIGSYLLNVNNDKK